MKLQLTQAQMNEKWMSLRRLNTLPLDVVVQRHDGVDMDALVTEEVNKWYFNLLLTAPESMLAPHDIEDMLTLYPDAQGGARFIMPQGVVRILDISMRQWTAPVHILHDNIYPEGAIRKARRRQISPLTSASPAEPVAFMRSNEVTVYPYIPGDELKTCRVALMMPDIYEFDSSALSTILNLENPYDFTL